MDDLIFNPLRIICPECGLHIGTTIEELQYKEEITCPRCRFPFIPNIEVDGLIDLMKMAERGLEGDKGLNS